MEYKKEKNTIFIRKLRNPVVRTIVLGFAIYYLIGFIYNSISLYCYNVRNWEIMGGFSFPPLYFVGGFFLNIFLWPVFIWANLINGIGIFGKCFNALIIF